ncbi:MAG: hypothetical protein ACE5G8_15430 [Anaerolineae bacterium]
MQLLESLKQFAVCYLQIDLLILMGTAGLYLIGRLNPRFKTAHLCDYEPGHRYSPPCPPHPGGDP